VAARTLEAWVSPANLAQRGGGVVAVEKVNGHGFDALVFGEKNAASKFKVSGCSC
jgi:hypothetical protein